MHKKTVAACFLAEQMHEVRAERDVLCPFLLYPVPLNYAGPSLIPTALEADVCACVKPLPVQHVPPVNMSHRLRRRVLYKAGLSKSL